MTTALHEREYTEPAIFQLLRPVEKVEPVEVPQSVVVDQRRFALRSLDPIVRRLLARVPTGLPVQVSALTAYEAVFPAIPTIGGHWTASSTWMGFFTHTISSYTVSLAFDDDQRPSHFVVRGSTTVRSERADEESLARALDEAAAAGPLRTSSPHVIPGFAL